MLWPFFGAFLLATLGSGDWVIMPIVMWLIGSFWMQFLALAILLNIEIALWYKFWRWFFVKFLPKRKNVQKTIDFTKEFARELKQKGYVERIVEFCEDTFEWAVHPDRWLFRLVNASRFFGLLFLGFEPFISGGRVFGVIFCVTTNHKNGLYPLMAGNCVHVLLSLGYWNLTFYLWHEYKSFFFLFAAVFILYLFREHISRKIKKQTP